jgi:hypothetical protein
MEIHYFIHATLSEMFELTFNKMEDLAKGPVIKPNQSSYKTRRLKTKKHSKLAS